MGFAINLPIIGREIAWSRSRRAMGDERIDEREDHSLQNRFTVRTAKTGLVIGFAVDHGLFGGIDRFLTDSAFRIHHSSDWTKKRSVRCFLFPSIRFKDTTVVTENKWLDSTDRKETNSVSRRDDYASIGSLLLFLLVLLLLLLLLLRRYRSFCIFCNCHCDEYGSEAKLPHQ